MFSFKFKSLLQLLDYFKDEQTCTEFLELHLWRGNPVCPHCKAENPYRTNRGFSCSNKDCKKKFSVTVGTVFQSSHIKLRTWYAAIYLITAHKKGISSCQLARDLNVTQKTAWFMLHRVREILVDTAPKMLRNTVEIDETFIGGKEKNKHGYRSPKQPKKTSIFSGTSLRQNKKTPVVGALERDGLLIMKSVPSTGAKIVIPFITENIDPKANIYTDEWSGYMNLTKKGYSHETIAHTKGEYVRGSVHTNTIEGAWSLFKRGIIGIYHQISPKHLDRYCNEFTYRYNSRKISDGDRFSVTIMNLKGRLKYKQLIAKEAA